MKAALREGGGIVFSSNHPIPKCSAKNVLVRVKAAGINPVDYKLGWPIFGKVVGLDMAGVVEKVGNKVTKFKEGDEVYGVVDGSLADFTVADPNRIALKPKSASFAEAASMPTAYVTSLQALRDHGGLKADGKVLVIGASGGCGLAAIQLAKSFAPSRIVGVCSGRNEETVRSLGATEVIDYTKTNVTDFCSTNGADGGELKFDVIYDAASSSGGGENYRDSSAILLEPKSADRNSGNYVAINGTPWMWARAMTIGLSGSQHLFAVKIGTAELEHLSKLVDDGWVSGAEGGEQDRLKPFVSQVLPLDEENLAKGFEMLKSRRTVGKIVFQVEGDVDGDVMPGDKGEK